MLLSSKVTVLFSLLPVFAATNSSFTPGEICQGVNTSTPASEMLRGKHLVINEMVWSPYASKQAAAATGWVGLNVDLHEKISEARPFRPAPAHTCTAYVVARLHTPV